MTEIGSYKWIEVLLLVLAGVGFYLWQMRDLRQAREASRQAAAAELDPPTAQPTLPQALPQAPTQTSPAPLQGQPSPPP